MCICIRKRKLTQLHCFFQNYLFFKRVPISSISLVDEPPAVSITLDTACFWGWALGLFLELLLIVPILNGRALAERAHPRHWDLNQGWGSGQTGLLGMAHTMWLLEMTGSQLVVPDLDLGKQAQWSGTHQYVSTLRCSDGCVPWPACSVPPWGRMAHCLATHVFGYDACHIKAVGLIPTNFRKDYRFLVSVKNVCFTVHQPIHGDSA